MPAKNCSVLAFVPNALIASEVGAWESDVTEDRIVADAKTAELFGVDTQEASWGLPLDRYIRNIHPDDRTDFSQKLSIIRERGGLFVVEYRTCPSPTDVRWVLARGRYERDPRTGHTVGRGIVIDITDSKSDGRVEDRAFFTTRAVAGPSLEHVAELAMEAQSEIDELGEREDSPLRRAVDALLWILGRTLARQGSMARTQKGRLN
jgi:hypothetical protein